MEGRIIWISGPAVRARIRGGIKMHSLAAVGREGLLGEVVAIDGDTATIQVYEDTTGLEVGEEVVFTGRFLSVELGPGLLGRIFDGLQRPLHALREMGGDFIRRGIHKEAIERDKGWDFHPLVSRGEEVGEGDVVGIVDEGEGREHRIMVPKGVRGKVKEVRKGLVGATEPCLILEDGREVKMVQEWPIRIPRPYKRRLPPTRLFITGQRVIDTFFPVSEGGVAIIPGGFGTGKTVTEQTLAKYSMADIIVYVGCGERGNEMSEFLREFPRLKDPKTGRSLLSRTIVVVNTSNMPVAAREASIYTGITMAEYYRDMGYSVALFADSTSRWAEALREMSSRMEEMPGEEGYPSYLASRLGSFYERAGRVVTLGSKEREGAVTVVGAVSPPGGDFSEPVTQASLRIGGTLWALDTDLAYRRHFPAINWLRSYSQYIPSLRDWYRENVKEDWAEKRERGLYLLQKEEELKEVVMLIGPDALQDRDRLTLEAGRLIRDGFLRQNAFSDVDAFCPLKKQYLMLDAFLRFYDEAMALIEREVPVERIIESPLMERLLRLSESSTEEVEALLEDLPQEIRGMER